MRKSWPEYYFTFSITLLALKSASPPHHHNICIPWIWALLDFYTCYHNQYKPNNFYLVQVKDPSFHQMTHNISSRQLSSSQWIHFQRLQSLLLGHHILNLSVKAKCLNFNRINDMNVKATLQENHVLQMKIRDRIWLVSYSVPDMLQIRPWFQFKIWDGSFPSLSFVIDY